MSDAARPGTTPSLPIAAAATVTGYFEKSRIFDGQSRINLSDALQRHEAGLSFGSVGLTTQVATYTIENAVLAGDTLILHRDGRAIPETAYFVPDHKRNPVPIDPARLVQLDAGEDLVLGYNNAHAGYQHWLTQCLPAIDSSLRRERTRSVRLLLPALAP